MVYHDEKEFIYWVIGEGGTHVLDTDGDRYLVIYPPDLPSDRQNVVLAINDGKLYEVSTLKFPVTTLDWK